MRFDDILAQEQMTWISRRLSCHVDSSCEVVVMLVVQYFFYFRYKQ